MVSTSMDDFAFLDEIAANARPARVQQGMEGWRLRASDGVTRRANSVLTNGPVPRYAGWFEEIEAFYRRQNLPPRYQISDASPSGLDDFLAERGYTLYSPTSVMIGTTAGVLSAEKQNSGADINVAEKLTDNWLDVFIAAEGFPEIQAPLYRHTFSSLGQRAAYADARLDGAIAGVGMSVAERGWAGLFSIVTFPEFRRRGVARGIVVALADWAHHIGSEHLYLQVVGTNEPAVRLYEQLGFRAAYTYHYREKLAE